MRRVVAGMLVSLILVGVCFGELRIEGETKVKVYTIVKLEAMGVSTSAQVDWTIEDSAGKEIDYIQTGAKLYFTGPPGVYKVSILSVDFDKKKFEKTRVKVTIEGKVVPPDPGPTPPPDPGPTPTPSKGMRVLFLYESAEKAKLPASQVSILNSTTFRGWLDTKCDQDPNFASGKSHTLQDKDTDLSALGKGWEAARVRLRTSLPWIILMDSAYNVVYEGGLPADIEATKALISKYTPVAKRSLNLYVPDRSLNAPESPTPPKARLKKAG